MKYNNILLSLFLFNFIILCIGKSNNYDFIESASSNEIIIGDRTNSQIDPHMVPPSAPFSQEDVNESLDQGPDYYFKGQLYENVTLLKSNSDNSYKCHNYSSSQFIYDTFYIDYNINNNDNSDNNNNSNNNNNNNNNNNIPYSNNPIKIEINSCIENPKKTGEYVYINQFLPSNIYSIQLSEDKECEDPYFVEVLNCKPYNFSTNFQDILYSTSDGNTFIFKYSISNSNSLEIEKIKQLLPRCVETPNDEINYESNNEKKYNNENNNNSSSKTIINIILILISTISLLSIN